MCAAFAVAQAAPPGDLGATPNQKPALLEQVGIDQHLNQQIPLDATFVDENGQTVQLRQYFGQKPVIITMVYYTCPMLCSQVLNGLSGSINGIVKFNAGRDFNIVSVSFDPRDTAEAAMAEKKKFSQRYHRSGSDQGWHFLTGKKEQIDALASALGFRYAWDPEIQQYAHASAIMLLTPDGHIAQYYYGIEYSPRDLQLGIVEASHGKVGGVVDQVLLYCYHYDPRQGRYGAAVMNILRISALATVLVLGGFMFVMLRRDTTLGGRGRLNKAS
jgi:protein SCO1/2